MLASTGHQVVHYENFEERQSKSAHSHSQFIASTHDSSWKHNLETSWMQHRGGYGGRLSMSPIACTKTLLPLVGEQ